MLWLIAAVIFVISTWGGFALFQVRPEWFYFRSFEYCSRFACDEEGWNGNEKGDLSREFAFLFQESWPTKATFDSRGFRSVPACKSPPSLVFWGDSFTRGAALSDGETLPWLVGNYTNTSVFNASGGWLGDILSEPVFSQAKIVVEVRTERSIGGRLFDYRLEIGRYGPPRDKQSTDTGLLDTANPKRWHPWYKVIRFAKGMWNDASYLIAHNGNVPRNLYDRWSTSEERIERTIASIHQHSTYLESTGYKYVFVIIPSKQTVYGPDDGVVPQPLSLAANDIVISRLSALGVRTVNLMPLFKLAAPTKELFFGTDSHWRPYGAQVAAQAITSYLHKERLLKDSLRCE